MQESFCPNRLQYFIHVHSARFLRPCLLPPFLSELGSEEEKLMNTHISSVRVEFEHK